MQKTFHVPNSAIGFSVCVIAAHCVHSSCLQWISAHLVYHCWLYLLFDGRSCGRRSKKRNHWKQQEAMVRKMLLLSFVFEQTLSWHMPDPEIKTNSYPKRSKAACPPPRWSRISIEIILISLTVNLSE